MPENNKKKQFTVLDLFSGAGGISKGFENAGFKIALGVDFDSPSIETYKRNFGKSRGLVADLSKLSTDEIKTILKTNGVEKINVVVGGPPCQGFSSARRHGDGNKDPRNSLFKEFARIVNDLKPEFFVMENVKGILSSDNGKVKDKIIATFKNMGYDVSYKILLAYEQGVPQKRQRVFFVGNRIGVHFHFPEPIPEDMRTTVHDAISDLLEQKYNSDEKISFLNKKNPITEFQKRMRKKSDEIFNHEPTKHANKVVEMMKYVPQGGNWRNIPELLLKSKRENRHSSAYRRLTMNEPSITIDTGNSHCNYYHPIFHRIPTVRESARIQSFPDDFVFEGSRSQQYKQVGNAVPPLLAERVALSIKRALDKK